MRIWLLVALTVVISLWAGYAALLLELWTPTWLPHSFLNLTTPTTLAEFGEAFSAIESVISAIALILGISAVLIQAKQNKDSNTISALTARQQFLLTESSRIEQEIQALKQGEKYDKKLFENMVNKKSAYLKKARTLDKTIEGLIQSI